MITAVDVTLRIIAGMQPAVIHVEDAGAMSCVRVYDEYARILMHVEVAAKRDAVVRHLMRLLPDRYSYHDINDRQTEIMSYS